MPKNAIQVVDVDIKKLTQHSDNPRKINQAQLNKLKKQISEHPEYLRRRPLLVNKTSKGLIIYAGNQRHAACLELGFTHVPCIVENNLPEDVMKARMLKDNTHAGAFRFDSLTALFNADLLDELDLSDMSEVSFGRVLAGPEKAKEPAEKEGSDNKPAPKEKKLVLFYDIMFQSEQEKEDFNLVLSRLKTPGEPIDRFFINLIMPNYTANAAR